MICMKEIRPLNGPSRFPINLKAAELPALPNLSLQHCDIGLGSICGRCKVRELGSQLIKYNGKIDCKFMK